MTIPCDGSETGSQILPQTLFLGASVVAYNVNMGWGGQPSSLSVELINDSHAPECLQPDGETPVVPLFKRSRRYPDNHYHDCEGDDCYVDENGNPYNSQRQPPPLSKNIPGKVYYKFDPQQGLVSQYWFDEDPGFFGDFTKVDINGEFKQTGFFTSYDIIGTPVYFVLDGFIVGSIMGKNFKIWSALIFGFYRRAR